jgi:CubicO group peptidase (beta-lactamase class C family)
MLAPHRHAPLLRQSSRDMRTATEGPAPEHQNRLAPGRARLPAVALLLAIGSTAEAVNTTPVKPTASTTVSPALQEVRRHMLDGDVNALIFHSMDQLYFTREVTRSGPVWVLPHEDADLTFEYTFDGSEYSANQFLDRTYTNALLIIKHSKIVYENYRNLTNERTRFISFSMAKSITSILIGIALAEGRIHSIDDLIVSYVPQLKGSGYDGVTIGQVMRMRSGVGYDERYDFGTRSQAQQVFENAIVQNVKRFADLAPSLRRELTPGAKFNYSTMDTAVLGWMLENAVGQPLATYMTTRLWEPLGAEADGFWIADGAPGIGRALNGMGFNATLRDYARIGLMMLHKGRAMDQQIVPREWIERSTASTAIEGPHPPNRIELGYGYQWWTLHGTGAYTALGLQGQFLYIDPVNDTVVVKLSYFPPGDNSALEAESLAFFRAASAWKP